MEHIKVVVSSSKVRGQRIAVLSMPYVPQLGTTLSLSGQAYKIDDVTHLCEAEYVILLVTEI